VVSFREGGEESVWYDGAVGTFDGTSLHYQVSVEY
jgi:hypothetical protein